MDGLVGQLLSRSVRAPEIAPALSAAEAAGLVAELKAEADRHWWINANRSLELAELIVQIGQVRGEQQHTALGLMARGDALKFLGRAADAWEVLGEAGRIFREVGDEVGWARSRIGRLLICVDLRRVAEALADAAEARSIFSAAGVLDKRLVLDMNTAIVYHLLGDYPRSLELYQAALATAEASPAIGEPWLGPIRSNIGYVYDLLGEFRLALEQYALARGHFAARDERRGVALVDYNSAHIAMAQGHYRTALRLLHQAHDFYSAGQLALDATKVDGDRVECYLLLNRFQEARELAVRVASALRAADAAHREALNLLHLAVAEAQLGDRPAARAALDEAERIFEALGATAWVGTARLRRGKLALQEGAIEQAEHEARSAVSHFQASGRLVDYAEAKLLLGRALLARGDLRAAAEAGGYALLVARRSLVPQLRYSAHLHLGRVAEAAGRTPSAARSFRAAVATVARVQQGLTITLRPGFLEDKGEALHALMAIYLREGRAASAFELLERVKSQALLSYLANHEHLRWPVNDTQAQALVQELDRLRSEHHWFARRANGLPAGPDDDRSAVLPELARAHIAAVEQRMRAITEQLYLLSDGGGGLSAPPSLPELQAQLGRECALVEYYTDGAKLWAFLLDETGVSLHALPVAPQELERYLDQLQLNMQGALAMGAGSPLARRLVGAAQAILGRLHDALLAPLAARLGAAGRLLVVPYGPLHYVPFHLLRGGGAYLIERHEVVVLPSAALLARAPLRRAPGAMVLAHSAEGQLPHVAAEAACVLRHFGGALYHEGEAVRGALRAEAAQILHIAAHGEHRLDQPDLSSISLADGQLYADDLLQQDLSYELVTLSACETGRAAVAPGDELIGLGRGVLYAGAGALITSLWRVADETTAQLMGELYRALRAGESKAAALRGAQRALLAANPTLHPAFWGAFQLMGDPGPLTAANE
jgi:CHAT domain-containing protein